MQIARGFAPIVPDGGKGFSVVCAGCVGKAGSRDQDAPVLYERALMIEVPETVNRYHGVSGQFQKK